MQLGFQIKYMPSNTLDLQGSRLACPAASASKIGDCWLCLVLLKAVNAPEQKTTEIVELHYCLDYFTSSSSIKHI